MNKRKSGFVQADSRNRLALGKFTDADQFLVEVLEDDALLLRPASVVPLGALRPKKESE